MTIAELQLGRMRPLPVDTHSLAGLERARRSRRLNLLAMLAIWAVIWLSAVGTILSAGDLPDALDNFLPLQLVAGLVATVLFFGGRSLRRGGWMRRMTMLPAAVTATGALMVVWSLGAGFSGASVAADSGAEPPVGSPAFSIQLVSL